MSGIPGTDFLEKQMQNTSGGNWLHDNFLQDDDSKKSTDDDKKKKRMSGSLVTNNWNNINA